MSETRFCQSSPSQSVQRHRQRGAAGFILMLLLGLAIGLFVIGNARDAERNSGVDEHTVLALSKAREALLGYAATYRDVVSANEVFGYLPCPDRGTGTEGVAATSCGSKDVTVIGRLPWRTLDIPPLRDASGECLWYAISGNFKNNPKTDLMNRDTNGLIEVMAADGSSFVAGALPRQRAVAVIFAPGAILPGQDRSLATTNPPTVCGGGKHYPSAPDTDKYDPANYLDTDIVSGINNAAADPDANDLTRFVAAEHADRTADPNDVFNDQLMPILPDEIFARYLDKRADFESYLTDPLTGILRKTADCLVAYGQSNDGGIDYKYLPRPAKLNVQFFGPPLNYVDQNPSVSNIRSGRLPRTVFFSAITGSGPHRNDSYDDSFGTEPLLRNSQCAGWDAVNEFWDNWKDHIFYAVAYAHRQEADFAENDDPCIGSECINVVNPAPDPTTTEMAAVVIFSGARQVGQTRNNNANPLYSSADKADPANYLEGINVTAIQTNPTSDSDSNRVFSKIAGNDTIMCLHSVGPAPTILAVDPTCGATTCDADGDDLAFYRIGADNTCRLGSGGVDPDCLDIATRIDQNNCPGTGPTYSCERAARDFLSYECLQDITSTKCKDAHTALTTC